MFWDTTYSNSANIDALLNREDCSLKELLDDEDILQECKSQNQKLVKFLNRPEVVDELVSFITTEPPNDLDEKQRFLYPNVACEILTSDVPSLKQRIAEDCHLLNKLFSFFEQQSAQLNPLLASFICKTFGMLIMKKMEQDWFLYQTICLHVLEFIKSKENFLDVMLQHFATPVVSDLLLTMLNEVEDAKMKSTFLEWINEKGLIEKMIDVLCVPEESSKHIMVAQFLIELIKTGRCNRQSDTEDRKSLPNPLLQRLEQSQTTTRLIDAILCDTHTESGILSGLQVLLCLLENSIIQEPVSQTALQQIIDAEKEHHDEIVASLMHIIQPRVYQLFELLLNPPMKSSKCRETLAPTLGNVRLQLCNLFTVLVETENSSIIEEISKTNFFTELLNLFKQYCWNNFLHNYVKRCFSYGVQAYDLVPNSTQLVISALQKHIIVDCKLADKLIVCWNENSLSQQQPKCGRRLGYMGHLIDILSAINSAVSASEEFRALIESSLKINQALGSGESPPESKIEMWNKIMQSNEDELKVQTRLLADCDPSSERHEYGRDGLNGFPSIPDESENDTEDFAFNYHASMHNAVNGMVINDFNLEYNNDDDDIETRNKLFEEACNQNISTISFAADFDTWEQQQFFNNVMSLDAATFDDKTDQVDVDDDDNKDPFSISDPFESAGSTTTSSGFFSIIGNNNISSNRPMYDYHNGAYDHPNDFLMNFYASQCTNYPFTATTTSSITTNIPPSSGYNPFHHNLINHDDVNSNNDNWANFNSSPDNFADFDSHFASTAPIGVESILPSSTTRTNFVMKPSRFVSTTQVLEISSVPPQAINELKNDFQLGSEFATSEEPTEAITITDELDDEEFFSLRDDSNEISSFTEEDRKLTELIEQTEVPEDDDDDFASADESSSKGNSEEETNSNGGDQFVDCTLPTIEDGRLDEDYEIQKLNGVESKEDIFESESKKFAEISTNSKIEQQEQKFAQFQEENIISNTSSNNVTVENGSI